MSIGTLTLIISLVFLMSLFVFKPATLLGVIIEIFGWVHDFPTVEYHIVQNEDRETRYIEDSEWAEEVASHMSKTRGAEPVEIEHSEISVIDSGNRQIIIEEPKGSEKIKVVGGEE